MKEILRLVDESQFDEFELETPRLTHPLPRGDRRRPRSAPPTAAAGRGAAGLVDVTAPMVGTFYRAPAPGEPPFVEVGSPVERDTQVCILEVMKLMSSVVAGVERRRRRGLSSRTARPVEYGDVLFRIRPDA